MAHTTLARQAQTRERAARIRAARVTRCACCQQFPDGPGIATWQTGNGVIHHAPERWIGGYAQTHGSYVQALTAWAEYCRTEQTIREGV